MKKGIFKYFHLKGRKYMIDNNGYFCSTDEKNLNSNCCKNKENRFNCNSCNSTFNCCSIYENCVSCNIFKF